MVKKNLQGKEILAIGLMLFALFLGAGNMIFPPFLGQEAGHNVWIAVIGFLITGVGLPLLGVIAIARNGDLQTLASRVHPVYGVIFTIIMYLAIGPFFGIPRTGTVAYEIGVTPFLPENVSKYGLPLFLYTIVFFGITIWLSMNPSKLVDRIGKIFTPALLIILTVLVVKSFITPMGETQAPKGEYIDGAFFKGFIEGYLTMDTIAALVFGIVVISAIQDRGITSKSVITKACIYAGVIAAAGLALVYLSLAFIGATGFDSIGEHANGGALLSAAANFLYGSSGAVILGLAITFACLTTSVGLVSSCAQYFSKLIPALSYKKIVVILSIFSMVIANVGLTQLITVSLPILIMIYPLAIVLILVSFFHNQFGGYSVVYIGALIPTGIISFIDGLKVAGVNVEAVTNALNFLPLFDKGIGWIVPALLGALIGYVIASAFGFAKKPVEIN
ncbi:branched-chain amino acid transport system II carrier protein [Cytobacillus spongiae]|jgi:LIVCS family branched-chain amino acid:cation transporter|uniref:branched-chain amino acid transport system II carrier protein n=1 Tax=Cytobacillus spongiae TaxID=2901381 RepID=UPI001F232696|nr:branched-chain amino acid transport system II carrier protein [Cytobacillus spongiae]UII55190.1 branched-chain amino acid transport system II carrier protein [Cytobacillus spongiae]